MYKQNGCYRFSYRFLYELQIGFKWIKAALFVPDTFVMLSCLAMNKISFYCGNFVV